MNVLETAIKFAEVKHSGQFRRDGKTSSITHVKAVADAVEGDIAKTIAVLHRLLEDTDTTIAELHSLFPPKVVSQVFLLTRRVGEDYDQYARRVAGSELATTVKQVAIEQNLADAPTESQSQHYAVAIGIFADPAKPIVDEAIKQPDIESQYVGEMLYIPASEGKHTGGLASVTSSDFCGHTRQWLVRFGEICKIEKFDREELLAQQDELREQFGVQEASPITATI